MSKIKLYSNNCANVHEQVCSCGIYAHGKLEDMLEFDILSIPYIKWIDKLGFKLYEDIITGIHDVIVMMNDEIPINATMYYWTTGELCHCGLVVLKPDIKSNKFAFEQYINKSEIL